MSRRGIALIMTLMVTVLLAMLVSAFFQLYRDQVRRQGHVDSDSMATAAVLSGLEYARMRLEGDHNWGLPERNGDKNLSIAGMTIFEDDSLASTPDKVFSCVGVLRGGSHFQISVVAPYAAMVTRPRGRFEDRSIEASPAGPPSGWQKVALPVSELSINYLNAMPYSGLLPAGALTPRRALPPGTCMLQVRGYCNGIVHIGEADIGQAKVSEASLAAGGSMSVDVENNWKVETMVAGKNRIEAGGNLTISGSPKDTAMVFQTGTKGLAASQKDISVGTGISSISDLNDGRLTVNYDSTTPIEVKSASAKAGGQFKPGKPVSSVPDLGVDEAESLLNQSTFTTVSLPGGNYKFTLPNQVRLGGMIFNDEIRVGNTLVAKLSNYQMQFQDKLRVDFSGPTTIGAVGSARPGILMGYSEWGYLPWDSDGTMIKVNQGSFSVDGDISGRGSVMATGNATNQGDIVMRGKSQMSSDPDSSVTLFAEKNIRVSAPDPNTVDFYSFDLSPISQGLKEFAPTKSNKWDGTATPLNFFSNLKPQDQNTLTQGGNTPVDDSDVSASSIKTAPVTQKVDKLIREMKGTFSVLKKNPVAETQFDNMVDMFTQPGASSQITTEGMTVGRYLRLRAFARELQAAEDAGLPLPSSDPTAANASVWANVTLQNDILNDQLRSEISFFDRKAWPLGYYSLKSLVFASKSEDPARNPLTSSMDSRDARWNGLMYARGSIRIDGGSGALDVRGGLTARQDVAVTNVSSVRTVFDPTLMDGLLMFSIGSRMAVKLDYRFFCMR